ncbi:pyridoxamine 5'-phosphate oxidase family protein [Paenibacillus sp. MMS20-IR301]|uniref:pyridoxamine 5'-phosphate oxidase family protein n=1 Tax=Paenibacillus sp. MMS20-IR301 TaxID=2895946 RepID=UPI0028E6F6C0|nr:pyridoxamine 5'-phosphate oxidase family protein [Paenibacillus sp. MMS20-IR301]WNS44157.1 pyridoxamine 5'-phosphate oxidase family protein [Paenibacillus sp. MMS20-IR301]
MDYVQGFKEIMEVSGHLALATSADNKPNVRVMSHFYDADQGIVYVSTFKQSPKTAEFAANDKIAFTTLPEAATGRLVRVTDATVKKSEHSVYDLEAGFTKNNPSFAFTLKEAGPMFEVYEFHFNEAIVTMGHMQMETITL